MTMPHITIEPIFKTLRHNRIPLEIDSEDLKKVIACT